MDILEQSGISRYFWCELDAIGEWWISSPDGQAEMRVTEEGEPRSYAHALEGIEEAMRVCAMSDDPRPFEDWSLNCNDL